MFGEGGGQQLADDMDLPFLGSIALRPEYRDTSRPTVLGSDSVQEEYRQIVNNLRGSLERIGKAPV
jgi:hypothetical protein